MLLADRYRLQAPLGRGAMGEVWRAHDELLDRALAVKVLPYAESDEVARERFGVEARAAARVEDPHVVTVYDYEVDREAAYLIMELVDGGNLAQEMAARGPMTPDRVRDVGRQVAMGLDAAHRHGVVHRDIKPANLLLAADGAVKIADFGIARLLDDSAQALTLTGQVLGTCAYLAPERVLGRAAEPASDVYALGCVLYELLTGRPPFVESSALAAVRRHVENTPPPPSALRPGIPSGLEDCLLDMLAKDPRRRPPAALVADWPWSHTWPPAVAPVAPTVVRSPAPAGTGSAPTLVAEVAEPAPERQPAPCRPQARSHWWSPARRRARWNSDQPLPALPD